MFAFAFAIIAFTAFLACLFSPGLYEDGSLCFLFTTNIPFTYVPGVLVEGAAYEAGELLPAF